MPVTIDELISGVSQVFTGDFTEDQVLGYLRENHVDHDSLASYIKFNERSYARSQIYREDPFEAALICWEPGQHSVVHRHLNQFGWMTVLRGHLVVTKYVKLRSNLLESEEPDINWSPVNSIYLRPEHQLTVHEGDVIQEVIKPETIHMTENPASDVTPSLDQQAISLHICWQPSSISVIYDVENHRCRTVRMKYI